MKFILIITLINQAGTGDRFDLVSKASFASEAACHKAEAAYLTANSGFLLAGNRIHCLVEKNSVAKGGA